MLIRAIQILNSISILHTGNAKIELVRAILPHNPIAVSHTP